MLHARRLCASNTLIPLVYFYITPRERRGWYPLGQLEEELDAVLARTGDQVVEVLHFMGGEDT